MNRREFLRVGCSLALGVAAGAVPWNRARACPAVGGPGPYGPLLPADANGIRLPAGFRSRVIAYSDQTLPGTGYTWRSSPDGAAVFRIAGGYVYACNHETDSGGASAIRFDHAGRILDAYSILSNTSNNCAGGATPWGTWLSCEEVNSGRVYECDPLGVASATVRPALGTFKHEAAGVDLESRRIYLTEDQSNGKFYRFTPSVWGQLDSGLLEVATVSGPNVSWSAVPNPNPGSGQTPTRSQVPGSTSFNGGEGIACQRGHVYFSTKGDNRIWDYHPATATIAVLYAANLDPAIQLTGVDNVSSSRAGDVLVAEDGGNMELVLIGPDCTASPLLRVVGQDNSEITGPAFDPTGRRLYFNSQQGGPGSDGITYEITGPFRRL